jgi:hypothetical protein
MKRMLLTLLATTTLIGAAPQIAAAQPWMGINERQAQLDQRIDAGVRSGQLTRIEAARLRAEFQDIAALETRYRIDGLSPSERADLDQRFDHLSARIRIDRQDDQRADRPGDWSSINERQAQLDQRIDAGVRSGQLTRPEAARLRAEFQDLVALEARYRHNGLSPGERAELNSRFDQLSARIRIERRDDQRAGQRGGRWENLNQRQAQFQQRLDRAVRDGRISRRQAINLRMEFRSIANLEQQYRRGGLNMSERADLDRRFDRLQANFRASVRAQQYDYGYGQAPNLFDYLFGVR